MFKNIKFTQSFMPTLAILLMTSLCVSCSANEDNDKDLTTLFVTPSSTGALLLNKTSVLTGRESPWDIAFLPDGDMLFTEKCKGVSILKTSGEVIHLFGSYGASMVASDLFCEGQSGAHGIAIDPQFAGNRTIFLFMASSLKKNPRTNRVVRLTLNQDDSAVTTRTDIVTDIAFKEVGNSWGGAGSHSGGRLRFGPDGYLYVTTGDNHSGTLPQNLQRLGGKVLRIDRDGKAAPGNNAPAGGIPRIFTYGHRNVQGICFQPSTGSAFIAEHGPNHSDEVTRLSPGGNGGWDPQPDKGVNCADNYCGYTSNNLEGLLTSMTDLKKFPTALKPILSMDDSQGLGPCEFLVGSQWKNWNGAMVLGVMGGARLDVIQISSTGTLKSKETANLPAARTRTAVQGPDGNLYIATDEGEISQVKPN